MTDQAAEAIKKEIHDHITETCAFTYCECCADRVDDAIDHLISQGWGPKETVTDINYLKQQAWEEIGCPGTAIDWLHAQGRLSQPAVPEGYALVPMEPTVEQIEAGFGCKFVVDGKRVHPGEQITIPIYKAMIRANREKE